MKPRWTLMPTYDHVADRAEAYARKGTSFTAVKDGVLKAGYCLKFSRSCAGALGGVLNATTAWRNAKHRHTAGTPPRGSFVFWEGGTNGHGHVSVSAGGGDVWTTDFKRFGKVDRVSIKAITTKWRNLRYVGWSEDINGVRVSAQVAVKLAPPKAPTVRTHTVKRGDTLWDIAEDVYGDGQQWTKIAKASGIKDGDELAVGQRLRLP